jgi:serine/threonine protein kinase
MEYVEGSTLKELVSSGRLPLAKTLAYGVQIAGGLAKTHAAGVVHRDLRRSNVMVTCDGQIKLLDFGLAKLAEIPEAASDETATLGLTQEGMALGSVGYMSPEQAEGLRVDARSDIFSFGLVLYEMLTGQRAFQRASKLSTLAALLHESPAPLHAHLNQYPPELKALLDRCLHKKPERRFQTIPEVRQALESIVSLAHTFSASAVSRIPSAPRPERGLAIAVLPFTNLSSDPDHQYFSDGLAGEIITALSNLRSLQVTTRTSAFRFRSKELDLPEVGEKLRVDYILLGKRPPRRRPSARDRAARGPEARILRFVGALRPNLGRRLPHSRRDRQRRGGGR